MRRLGAYLRANAVAFVALTVALGMGTAWASGLAPNSVYSRHIRNGQVKAPDIANGTVNAKKLAAASVTSSKIAAGAVGSAAIADSSVMRNDLAAGALDGVDASLLAGHRATDFVAGGGRLTSRVVSVPASHHVVIDIDGDTGTIGELDLMCTTWPVGSVQYAYSPASTQALMFTSISRPSETDPSDVRVWGATVVSSDDIASPHAPYIVTRWVAATTSGTDPITATIDASGYFETDHCVNMISIVIQRGT